MAGERSAQIVDLVARASARVARRVQLVNDYYAPSTPLSEARELQFERYMQHFEQFGHFAPHEGCNHPVCLEAAQMIQVALAAFSQQMMQPQGQADGSPQ